MIRRLSIRTDPMPQVVLPFQAQRLESVPVLRTEAPKPKIGPLPLQTLRIPNLHADLLLPAGAETAEATLALYREQLKGIFSAREALVLAAVKTEPSPAFDPDQPVVGIILNDPLAFHGRGGVEELCSEMRELGCRVVLIPPCADLLMPEDPAGRANGIRSMVRYLDGLIGPGGEDVDPAIYGEKNRHTKKTNLRRDRFEADFALTAKDELLFMFGICRSHQLWSAADGGTLGQDVIEEGWSTYPLRQKQYGIPFDQPLVLYAEDGSVLYEKRVHVEPDSRMAAVTHETEFGTNANHHQVVDRPGESLKVVGTSHDAGTGRDMVEATERWNAFTVQWHPEAMWKDPLERRLLGTVARRAGLFRGAKRLHEQNQKVTAQDVERWYNSRFGLLDQSDSKWLRRDLIPHWYGKLFATGSVYSR